jgi:hypothetical protein
MYRFKTGISTSITPRKNQEKPSDELDRQGRQLFA